MPEGYFSCERDNEIIADGGFFCEACLVGKPDGEQSDDPRYCHECFKFLLDEAGLLANRKIKIPTWAPHINGSPALPAVKEVVAKIPRAIIPRRGFMQRPNKEGILRDSTSLEVAASAAKRGRPRKTGEVHRVTAWRREKQETQAVML